MNILVTGGTGMVGRYLKELLPEAEYPSSKELNLLSFTQTKAVLSSYKPDTVIHLAGITGGIIDNIERPLTYFEDNVLINHNIVKACRELKIYNFITALSTCAYPDNFDMLEDFTYPIEEEDMHHGPPTSSNFGYGYTKRMLGVHVDLINKLDKAFNYCYLIPCNLFGEYDKYEDKKSHFVGSLLKKIIVAERENSSYIKLLGTGRPLRQFMYAKDVARLIVQMIKTGVYTNMNVCPGDVSSIDRIALDTLRALNLEHIQIVYTGEMEGQYRKDASNKKLRTAFPDFHLTPFNDAIKLTCDYLIKNNIV